MKQNVKNGEIYLYDFGKGEENILSGIRPVIVLQSDAINRKSKTCIIAAITSKKKQLTSHVFLDARFGLDEPSYVLIEQIRTVNQSKLMKKIGFVDDELVRRRILKAIGRTLGIYDPDENAGAKEGEVVTMCPKCAQKKMKKNEYLFKRMDVFERKREPCLECGNPGYHYILIRLK